jgi:hypothetical protein
MNSSKMHDRVGDLPMEKNMFKNLKSTNKLIGSVSLDWWFANGERYL